MKLSFPSTVFAKDLSSPMPRRMMSWTACSALEELPPRSRSFTFFWLLARLSITAWNTP